MSSTASWTAADERLYQGTLKALETRFQWQPVATSEGAPDAGTGAGERAACAASVGHWLDAYGRTFDPRLPQPLIPFRLFPRQREFLAWLAEREAAQEEGLAEKSRDVGFTWLCCAYALHGWLFRPGFSAGFGSRKLELVDRLGDPSCIFEKIRILLRHLPAWQLPRGFKWSEHDNHARLLNPETGAVITGEGGDEIGRGGRASIFFVDEAAFLERPARVEAALSQTTHCRIWVSTPNGPGNPFYRKRFGGKIEVFTFHWKDDPRKDEAWYARQVAALDPVTVAQEIDIDYAASVEGVCIPAKWVRAAVGLDLPASGPVVAGFDVAGDGEGADQNVLITRQGPCVREPVAWSRMNTTRSAWKARGEAEAAGVTQVCFDCVGLGEGIKATWESAETKPAFATQAVAWGSPPSSRRWSDGKTSQEKFLNLRMELWWVLRERFRKTFESVTDGIAHPPDELISIPNHPGLIADLSLPLVEQTETGKLRLEAKSAMRRRGVKSPDHGDALAFSFAPLRAAPAGFSYVGKARPS